MTKFKLINEESGKEREFETKDEAEEVKQEQIRLGVSEDVLEIQATEDMPREAEADGGSEVVVEQSTDVTPSREDEEVAVRELEAGVNTDPLEILPNYMIDHVKGEPTLNKRGLSVLAYHYGVSVEDREIIVSPHESEWEFAIVETTVTNGDGNTFVGTGTSHVDRGDEREVLLELAETRSYKRAVSFGTGTGIVSYQEMIGELE